MNSNFATFLASFGGLTFSSDFIVFSFFATFFFATSFFVGDGDSDLSKPKKN